jgi:peptidoglycan/xylan/chitin deacetylase (PgdA/CDA1 family)
MNIIEQLYPAAHSPRPVPVPWTEGNGKLRIMTDLLTIRYPSFVWGGSIGHDLPVFHFHEVQPEALESRLRYLAENGYQTVTSKAISHLVRQGIHPGPRRVALCFDDAWASLWTVAGPLLRKYSFQAITYAIPARISDSDKVRPTLDDGLSDPAGVDRSDTPFATWPELRALQEQGTIDVQSHTMSHSWIFSSSRLEGFVTPNFRQRHLLLRPLISSEDQWVYLSPDDLGAPLYPQRPRMSDGRRFLEDPEIRERLKGYVARAGGAAFFSHPGWRKELKRLVQCGRGDYESPEQQRAALLEELAQSRDILNERLGTNSVRHICFPWTIAGNETVELMRKVGYETAFSNRLFGLRAVKAGDPPYRLMRLNNKFIFHLPGRDRRIFKFHSIRRDGFESEAKR